MAVHAACQANLEGVVDDAEAEKLDSCYSVSDVMAPKALLVVALATSATALTVPILSLDHGPLPLDILRLDELPEGTLRQLKLESGGGPRLLGLLDGEPAVGARGVLCHVEEHGDDGHRALAFSRFEVADQPSLGGGPTRLAVCDVAVSYTHLTLPTKA